MAELQATARAKEAQWSQQRCMLPDALTRSLDEYSATWAELEVRPQQEPQPALVSKCWGALHRLFAQVCTSVFVLPAVTGLLSSGSFEHRAWRRGLDNWAAGQDLRLRGYEAEHPECLGTKSQLKITGRFLEDFSENLQALAANAAGDSNGVHARRWIYRFQSAWSMTMYYVTCLQYFSLSALEPANEFAYDLHQRRFASGSDDGWAKMVRSPPTFRLVAASPLRHDTLSASAALAAVLRRMGRGGRVRFAEVGVFKANLSAYVWDRAGFRRGGLELHLVDAWGHAVVPGREEFTVGTGSNMGGESNNSLYRSVVRRFNRGATNCIHVPHWLPGRGPLASVALGGDVFFHRTTSVGGSRAFPDRSLDAVYIDADHKWWSVVQDIEAWWPKVKPGGVMLGHDFHLNSLMERQDGPGGDSNDVPLVVISYFRAPLEVVLHSGYVWSVTKPLEDSGQEVIGRALLCALLRRRMAPHYDFEICEQH